MLVAVSLEISYAVVFTINFISAEREREKGVNDVELVPISHEEGSLLDPGDHHVELSDEAHGWQSRGRISGNLYRREYEEIQIPNLGTSCKIRFQIMKASMGYLNVLRGSF